MTTWFTSDHHFNHEKILELVPRPFSTVAEMNEELIRRHNAVVKPNDAVYFVGDVLFGKDDAVNKDLITRMHGVKSLIRGNHDRGGTYRYLDWGFHHVFKSQCPLAIEKYWCLLKHKPVPLDQMRHMNGLQYKLDFYIHGHTHRSQRRQGIYINVCLEAWDYAPVSMEELIKLMEAECSDGSESGGVPTSDDSM